MGVSWSQKCVLLKDDCSFRNKTHHGCTWVSETICEFVESACNARLHVETEAGNAFVSLQVGIGQAQPLLGGGGRQGGSPANQCWRDQREAERQVKAEEDVLDEENNVTEKKSEKGEKEYKLEIDAHVKCKNYDVVEAIKEN